LDEKDFDEDYP